MKKITFIFFAFLLSAWIMTGCGGGSDHQDSGNKGSENSESSERKDGSGGDENAGINDLKGTMEALEEMGKNMQNGEKAELVNFRDLKEMLPEKVAGMKLVEKTGESSGAMGLKVSQAEGEYKDGDRSMKITIVDGGGIPMVMMGMAAWTTMEIDKESDSELARTLDYKGYKAYEEYNYGSKDGQFTVIVANRFIVTADGDNVKRETARDAMDDIPLGSLEKKAK
jgi:hypothetical protein